MIKKSKIDHVTVKVDPSGHGLRLEIYDPNSDDPEMEHKGPDWNLFIEGDVWIENPEDARWLAEEIKRLATVLENKRNPGVN